MKRIFFLTFAILCGQARANENWDCWRLKFGGTFYKSLSNYPLPAVGLEKSFTFTKYNIYVGISPMSLLLPLSEYRKKDMKDAMLYIQTAVGVGFVIYEDILVSITPTSIFFPITEKVPFGFSIAKKLSENWSIEFDMYRFVQLLSQGNSEFLEKKDVYMIKFCYHL